LTPILEAHALAKRYPRGVWALGGIDLEIPPGGITALVGPNAAGKSTLMQMWVGFERPTRGTVRVAGVDPWHDRATALSYVGYVPQSPALYDALSIEDHLVMAALLRPTFDGNLARQRLAQLGIPRSATPGSLSGGQQAQVSLALALGTRAKVLLLDEPLASLDPLARREFLQVVIEEVRANGTTALLTSHIVADVEQACERLIVLGVGQVLLEASVAEALATHRVSPADPAVDSAVATFTGPTGEPLVLHQNAVGRPASLEEIVLGYLAAARPALAPNQEQAA
jgi:ABC-2 type transport system ATP-binding protein